MKNTKKEMAIYKQNQAAELLRKEEAEKQVLARKLENNAKEFTDNKNGTVTHKKTGLTWQRCSIGQNWTGATCEGDAKSFTWDEAIQLTSNFAGKTDWRVPTKDELMKLVYCSDDQYNYSIDGKCINSNSVTRPTINTILFLNTPSSSFWSSSPHPGKTNLDSYLAWVIHFNEGIYSAGFRDNSYNFRLVRFE